MCVCAYDLVGKLRNSLINSCSIVENVNTKGEFFFNWNFFSKNIKPRKLNVE